MPHHRRRDEPPVYSFDGSAHPRYPRVPKDALYPCYFREQKMAEALLVYGVNYAPLMPRFKDMSGLQPWGRPEPALIFWGREKVVGYLTEQLRRFRPDVVVTLPVDGNNGNPQHCAASRVTILASHEARSANRYPEQLKQWDTWNPRKLYVQVSDDELERNEYRIVHPHSWELSCDHQR
ncbi:MAG: hypothetical protein AAFP90_08980 [Planctomycetota bacterium]